MLLSHTYNINNSGRVMDDFTDQDWFEESVEVIHNKNSADQPSPGGNVPPDLADLGLVLDVPLDEAIFFTGGEHASTSAQVQYVVEPAAQRPPNIIDEQQPGTSNSMEIDGGGRQLLDLDLSNQHHQPDNSARTSKELEQFGRAEFADRKCQYLNCPPTTSSLATLQPYLSQKPIQEHHPPSSWMNQQPQAIPHYHQMDSTNMNTGQYMGIPNNDHIYHNGGHNNHFQPINNSIAHQMEPAIHLPSDCLNEPPIQSHEFYADKYFHPHSAHGQQREQICMDMQPGPSSNFMQPSEQILHSAAPGLSSYQNHNSQQQLPPTPQTNTGNAKTVVAKKSKPKKKPSAAANNSVATNQNNQSNQQNESIEAAESSGLDQLFGSLFTNQQTATLEFNDPQLNMEFGALISRLAQLTEQQRMGMDVSAEIKEAEASIAECIMRNNTSSMPSNSNFLTPNCEIQNPVLNITPHQNSQNQQPNKPKKSKPKKKPPPKSTSVSMQNALIPPQLSASSFPHLPPTTAGLATTTTMGFSDSPSSLPQMLPPQNAADFLPSHHQPIPLMDAQIFPPSDGIALIMANANGGQLQQQIGGENRQQFLLPVEKEQPTAIGHQRNGKNAGRATQVHYIGAPSTSTTQIIPNAQQINSTAVLANPKNNNKIPNQPQHHFIVHQQPPPQLCTVGQQKEKFLSVLVPTDTSSTVGPSNRKSSLSKQQIPTIYTKKQIRVIAQESAEELAKRLEREKARRKERVDERFTKMREQIKTQDYKTPFNGKMDCVKRLLPFGFFMEPELSSDFLGKFDSELERHSKLMQERQKSVERRLQFILMREAMGEMHEERNLLLFLDAQFEKEALGKEIAEKAPNLATRHLDPLEGTSIKKPELEWEYDGNWDQSAYLNIAPFSPSPEPEIGEIYSSNEDESKEGKIADEMETEMEGNEELTCQSVGRFANVQVHLQPYYDAMEKMIKMEKEASNVPNIYEEGIKNEKTNNTISTNKSPEIIKFIHEKVAVDPVQQFSLENLVKEMVKEVKPLPIQPPKFNFKSQSPSNSSLIVPIMEKDNASIRTKEEMEKRRNNEECAGLLANGGSATKIYKQIEKKTPEKSPAPPPIPTVKLTIKLGNKKEEEKFSQKQLETDEEKKLRKEMKKARKAEKKAKKLAEKEKKKQKKREIEEQQKEIALQREMASSSGQNHLEKAPLKISLRRPPPTIFNEKMPEIGASKLGEESTIGTSGTLKLRILKKPMEAKVNEEAPKIAISQNGMEEEGKRERKERRKEEKRRRKREAESRNEMDRTKGEEEVPEKKVPRIKIKFGGEQKTIGGMGESNGNGRQCSNNNRVEELAQLAARNCWPRTSQPTTNVDCSSNIPGPSLSPSSSAQQQYQKQLAAQIHPSPSAMMNANRQFASPNGSSPPPTPSSAAQEITNNNKEEERERIQFSPCSSDDESDTELRRRTTQLLSKIGRLQ